MAQNAYSPFGAIRKLANLAAVMFGVVSTALTPTLAQAGENGETFAAGSGSQHNGGVRNGYVSSQGMVHVGGGSHRMGSWDNSSSTGHFQSSMPAGLQDKALLWGHDANGRTFGVNVGAHGSATFDQFGHPFVPANPTDLEYINRSMADKMHADVGHLEKYLGPQDILSNKNGMVSALHLVRPMYEMNFDRGSNISASGHVAMKDERYSVSAYNDSSLHGGHRTMSVMSPDGHSFQAYTDANGKPCLHGQWHGHDYDVSFSKHEERGHGRGDKTEVRLYGDCFKHMTRVEIHIVATAAASAAASAGFFANYLAGLSDIYLPQFDSQEVFVNDVIVAPVVHSPTAFTPGVRTVVAQTEGHPQGHGHRGAHVAHTCVTKGCCEQAHEDALKIDGDILAAKALAHQDALNEATQAQKNADRAHQDSLNQLAITKALDADTQAQDADTKHLIAIEQQLLEAQKAANAPKPGFWSWFTTSASSPATPAVVQTAMTAPAADYGFSLLSSAHADTVYKVNVKPVLSKDKHQGDMPFIVTDVATNPLDAAPEMVAATANALAPYTFTPDDDSILPPQDKRASMPNDRILEKTVYIDAIKDVDYADITPTSETVAPAVDVSALSNVIHLGDESALPLLQAPTTAANDQVSTNNADQSITTLSVKDAWKAVRAEVAAWKKGGQTDEAAAQVVLKLEAMHASLIENASAQTAYNDTRAARYILNKKIAFDVMGGREELVSLMTGNISTLAASEVDGKEQRLGRAIYNKYARPAPTSKVRAANVLAA